MVPSSYSILNGHHQACSRQAPPLCGFIGIVVERADTGEVLWAPLARWRTGIPIRRGFGPQRALLWSDLKGNLSLLDADAKRSVREAAVVSRGRARLSVRLESGLTDSVAARAHTEGIPVSGVVRKSLKTYTEDVGPEGVMIRLTPYYREQLVKRLREYPGQEPGAVLERFMQLALDGSWLLTDR